MMDPQIIFSFAVTLSFFLCLYLQPPASHRQLTSFSGFYPVRYSITSLFSCPKFCSIHQPLFIWLLPTFCSWVLEVGSLLDAVTLKKAMPREFKKWPYATETLYTNPPLRDKHSTVLHWNVAIYFCKKIQVQDSPNKPNPQLSPLWHMRRLNFILLMMWEFGKLAFKALFSERSGVPVNFKWWHVW